MTVQGHLMKRQIAEIERQLARRVWNAVDRSEAMKWRPGARPLPRGTPWQRHESQPRELTGDDYKVI